jgi:hypothetical protein
MAVLFICFRCIPSSDHNKSHKVKKKKKKNKKHKHKHKHEKSDTRDTSVDRFRDSEQERDLSLEKFREGQKSSESSTVNSPTVFKDVFFISAQV